MVPLVAVEVEEPSARRQAVLPILRKVPLVGLVITLPTVTEAAVEVVPLE
jgi:hypothetical protein